MPLVVVDLEKLVLAAFLGGLIGLEREAKHRSAGLRTNIFICVGAAMFTLLSDQLAVLHIGDHTRIAAQIIPGIGFIGAGSILHARGDLVTGITTASTLFVVASIGMAVGGDRYLIAIFATLAGHRRLATARQHRRDSSISKPCFTLTRWPDRAPSRPRLM